ncbi:hypothetical protein PR048_004172 [Dryococelus australis]|uniref:Uncharacterized protein n=1 Tax=Dryococelus australis TaxID=614101 RepID=A0ABQ9I4S9_9NEOP|nr:hypothetical protein PR048_004172 [Dryococelus australis]
MNARYSPCTLLLPGWLTECRLGQPATLIYGQRGCYHALLLPPIQRPAPAATYGAAPDSKGGGKREIPEKTRRPVASSGTIPTCDNLEATPPGIEPGTPWEASSVTTTPSRTLTVLRKRERERRENKNESSLGKSIMLSSVTELGSDDLQNNYTKKQTPSQTSLGKEFYSSTDAYEDRLTKKIFNIVNATWSSAGIKGRGKREILDKFRRPAASFDTIPTCGKSRVTRPGIEPGSPCWEASRLTAQPLRHRAR